MPIVATSTSAPARTATSAPRQRLPSDTPTILTSGLCRSFYASIFTRPRLHDRGARGRGRGRGRGRARFGE
ncbi:hypothetical protein LguiA_027564 [Lonicera macranthoides]